MRHSSFNKLIFNNILNIPVQKYYLFYLVLPFFEIFQFLMLHYQLFLLFYIILLFLLKVHLSLSD
ncbi:hypothetical protein GLOIN_2v1585053, partial [Rhizophagus irregularis DAOM 181602=DAOM 197198]